jgi:tryprostatin B 6-hydroxylase
VGKQVALMEIRAVVAMLVNQFEMKLEEGQEGWEDKGTYTFTLALEPFYMTFI